MHIDKQSVIAQGVMERSQAKDLGYAYYYTGRPCNKGHLDIRNVSKAACIVCTQDSRKKERESFKISTVISREEAIILHLTQKQARQLGHSYYYTGKECKRGHIDVRETSRGQCLACENERSHKRWLANPELYNARAKASRLKEDPSLHTERTKNYYKNNKEWFKQYSAIYRLGNREQAKIWAKNYYIRTFAENPEHYKNKQGARRTKITCDPKLSLFITALPAVECPYCEIDLTLPFVEVELDHVIPIARGGKHEANNLHKTCYFCNRSKGNKTEKEFLDYIAVTGLINHPFRELTKFAVPDKSVYPTPIVDGKATTVGSTEVTGP